MKHNRITTILLAVALLFFLSFCASTDDDDDDDDDKKTTATTTTPDTTAPAVSSTDPANGSMTASITQNITATFSEALDNATVNGTNFTLTDNASNRVTANVSYADKVATLNPDGNLTGEITYTATLLSSITDAAGNKLADNYTWSFTTDTTSPMVSATTPANGTMNVAASPTFTVKFSEKLDSATVNSTHITLTDNSSNTISLKNIVYDGNRTVTFGPSSDLSATTTYTANVTAGIKDLAGNALTAFSWEFHTDSAPRLSVNLPMNNSTATNNTNVIVVFDKEMNTGSINSTTFFVSSSGGNETGNVSHGFNNMQALFNPTGNLTNATKYTVTVLDSVKSSKGFAMAQNATFSFNSTDSADSTAPGLLSSDPANGTNTLVVDDNIKFTFSEDMNPATVKDNLVFTFKNNSTTVGYTLEFSNGTVFTLNPSANLAANTGYNATFNASMLDLAGNALSNGTIILEFTTSAD